jgi:hypothetical protein
MITVPKARNGQTRPSAWPYLGEEERLCSGKNDFIGRYILPSINFYARVAVEKEIFLNERRVNVIENKGPLWKTGRESGNVYENKAT